MSEKFFLEEKEFIVASESYAPKEDSFLLRECLEKELEENQAIKTALDLGCGTGLQGLTLAEKGVKVLCSDRSRKALANAEENFRRAGLTAEFKLSNLFSRIETSFDLIAFNPPYLPSEEIKYPDLEGGEKGRKVLDEFLESFPAHLNEGGVCLFLQSDLNGLAETAKRLKGDCLAFEVKGRKKLFFEELVVFKAWKA
jgi:release factor glutamine methyltransferase